jgi:hypothetical protein
VGEKREPAANGRTTFPLFRKTTSPRLSFEPMMTTIPVPQRNARMTPETTETQVYPGGDNHPGYKYALMIWMVLFLICLCFGLLNYLGGYLHGLK